MNSALRETVDNMLCAGRFPHAVLLYGDSGVGKKYSAKEISAMLLCHSGSQRFACGKCASCVLFKSGSHPDLIIAEHSGKRNGISVAEVRRICADASIAPNTSDSKVYLILDADAMEAAAQNALLKIIEEPPENVYFIFTAQSKSVFLPTILSRIVSIGVGECSESECLKALAEHGIPTEDAKRAYEDNGGNIGKCLLSINDDDRIKVCQTVAALVNCIISRDEYGFLKVCHSIETDSEMTKNVLSEMIAVVRDISACRIDSDNCIGIYRKGAYALSQTMSHKSVIRLYECISAAYSDIKMNVSPKLALCLLCSQIFN